MENGPIRIFYIISFFSIDQLINAFFKFEKVVSKFVKNRVSIIVELRFLTSRNSSLSLFFYFFVLTILSQ